MTQTELQVRSFFNNDPLTFQEHKSLPYRISQIGRDNAYQVARVENNQFMSDLINDLDDQDIYETEIEQVVEMLIEGETIRDDVEDFIEEYGVCELENFQAYTQALENYSQHTVYSFLENWSLDDIDHIDDAFWGHFDNVADFCEDYFDQIGESIPSWLCIDWDATWESALRFDYYFDEDNGVMWSVNW